MTHLGKKAANDWTTKAIEACRTDPRVAAAGLCYVCMTTLKGGCLCTRFGAIRAAGYQEDDR